MAIKDRVYTELTIQIWVFLRHYNPMRGEWLKGLRYAYPE